MNQQQHEEIILALTNENARLRAENKKLRELLDKPGGEWNSSRARARAQKYPGFGEMHTNAEWARRLGLNRGLIWRHLQRGGTIEELAEIREIKYP